MSSSSSVKLVVYRPDQFTESTAAIFHQMDGYELVPVKSNESVIIRVNEIKGDGRVVTSLKVYGTYYSDVDLNILNRISPGRVTVLAPEKAIIAKYSSSGICEDVRFEYPGGDIGFIANAWKSTQKDGSGIPYLIKLLDAKGRSDFSDQNVNALIEYIYVTQEVQPAVIKDMYDEMWNQKFTLDSYLAAGRVYKEKSDSMVRAIVKKAGTHILFHGHSCLVVDANIQIELIGEALCAKGASIGVITRYDHILNKNRITLYQVGVVNLVQLATDAGYSAGGTDKAVGFVTNQSVAEFISHNSK